MTNFAFSFFATDSQIFFDCLPRMHEATLSSEGGTYLLIMNECSDESEQVPDKSGQVTDKSE